jgi:titin
VPGVTATAGDATATVTWSAPTQWRRVTGYEVVIQPGGTPRTVPADQRTLTERGLVNGTQYSFVVTALSNGIRGKSSMSNPVIPAVVVPGSPTITSVTGGNGQITLSWQAPSGITVNEYILDAVPGSGGGAQGTTRAAGGQRSATIGGLTNGVTYTVDLRAITASGASNTVTSPPVMPRAVPNAPTVSASITAPGQVTVTWTVPAANGSTIGGYDVILVGGSTRRESASATQSVFTGLADGTTYSFRVVAVSDLGSSQPGLVSIDVQRNVPSAPGGLSAVPGDGAVTLTWTPATVTGTTIAEYRVLNLSTGVETTTTAASASVTNLVNGTTYTFEVRAVAANSAVGPASPPAVATPAGAPAAPVISAATATGPTAGTISWSQQSPSNGTTVVEWRVTGPAGTQSVSSPTATVGGLVHNTTNTVTIVAVGANGTVSAAASTTINTPSGAPGQVTGVSAWVDEYDRNGYVSWNAVAGADSYEINPGNGQPLITVSSSTLNASFLGTGPVGATYTVTVRAISTAFGAGLAGSAQYTIPMLDPCLQQQPPRRVICE